MFHKTSEHNTPHKSHERISVGPDLYRTLNRCDQSIEGISGFIALGVDVMRGAETLRGWHHFNHLMRRNKGRLIIY